eukprot:gb/GECH01012663.1/.p1 GENE.gb/GECH01012663.1/~~gb/GECH01012663.1/.p1  ORF type:complete len:436 (+),score=135.58 gb/GECH01012663.1/:1-1308(+)
MVIARVAKTNYRSSTISSNKRSVSNNSSVLGNISLKQQRNYAQVNKSGYEAPITHKINFVKGDKPMPVFKVLNEEGVIENNKYAPKDLTENKEKLLEMYKTMVKLKSLDDVGYNSQRQGRISFYMTNYGEEAAQIGSAAALANDDEVFAQYRETGVLMHRGFTLEQFMNQLFSNKHESGRGRQMPVHYGAKELHFQTISSPLGTQIPQAAGAGYALKMQEKDNVVMCYFGEGAASEGDFHAALNFAATLHCPTLFFCRNNGYAISTPAHEQYRGDGIVSRGLGYGMHSIRVDGNDLFAVYEATKHARKLAVENSVPVLIEAMTYRIGHHSTSDDSSRYRSDEELEPWNTVKNPIARVRKYLEGENLWNEEQDKNWAKDCRKAVLKEMSAAEKRDKPDWEDMFEDVYDQLPPLLVDQKDALRAHIEKYPDTYKNQH